MQLEIAALCDAATDQGGKLNLLGTFDRVVSPDFPMVLPQCTVAFRIRYGLDEVGEHVLELRMDDFHNNPLVPPLETNLPFPPVLPGRPNQAVNLVLNMQRLRITIPGDYQLQLRIDGITVCQLPLWVEDSTPHEPNPLKGKE